MKRLIHDNQQLAHTRTNDDRYRREIDQIKKEKDLMSDRQNELAMALKEVAEDLKMQKDENT